jgi:hypothetical protein
MAEDTTTPRERLEQEFAELRERIGKLREFIPVAEDRHQPELLRLQLEAMVSYEAILVRRLHAWQD